MKKLELANLVIAIAGMVTGCLALGWQVWTNILENREELALELRLLAVRDAAPSEPRFFLQAVLTNRSRKDVYIAQFRPAPGTNALALKSTDPLAAVVPPGATKLFASSSLACTDLTPELLTPPHAYDVETTRGTRATLQGIIRDGPTLAVSVCNPANRR